MNHSELPHTSPSVQRVGAPRPVGEPARRVRVLIADDSALIRQSLRRLLESDPEIEVLDTARDGLDALLKVEKLLPDVVTMDVEMPRLDGLEALRLLMERFPRPVVMFSSLTAAGTETTVRALALGAVDFVEKPSARSGSGLSSIGDEVTAKIKRAARARVRKSIAPLPAKPLSLVPRPTLGARPPDKLVVVGSSTGGPRALAELFAGLPADLPAAVVAVQHLPAGFTRSLAERLNQGSQLTIVEAGDGEPLGTGKVLLAPGDFHLRLNDRRVSLEQGPRRHGVRPSVDTTLEDAAEAFGPALLTVILTGMGEDGTAGSRAVKSAGGIVLAEDESSCVVYGMPRSVVEAGLADRVVPLDQMAHAIVRQLEHLPSRTARRVKHA